MEMDVRQYIGISAYGRAYQAMMEQDTHAYGSVDRVLPINMTRLCTETAEIIYMSLTRLETHYAPRTRPELESILSSLYPGNIDIEGRLAAIAGFTQRLGDRAEEDLLKCRFGGTEEEIIKRGSDWCTDVARVACILCQIAGFPCRMVYLFDLAQAYSGHVIVEAYRDRVWGAMDSSTGVVYRKPNGQPASVWHLMNNPWLIEDHRKATEGFYTTPGQFRAAGMANYYVGDAGQYDYTVAPINDYCLSILTMSLKGWPGGLRWLHGEEGHDGEQPHAADRAERGG